MSRRNPERVRAWRELIEAWKQSGLSINAFCRGQQLTRSNFDRWRRILAAKPAAEPPSDLSPDAHDQLAASVRQRAGDRDDGRRMWGRRAVGATGGGQ